MRATVTAGIKGLVTGMILADLSVFVVRYHVLAEPYMAAALMGSFLIHTFSRQRRGQLTAAFILAAGFALVYALARHESLSNIYAPAFLGVGSIAAQALDLIWGRTEPSASSGRTLLISMIFPLCLFCTAVCLSFLDRASAQTYDHFLYVFDASLGFSPSFAVGQLFTTVPSLRAVCYYAYEFLPLAMSVAFISDQSRSSRSSINLLVLFLTTSISGYVVYHLYPAVGPIYVWPNQFPWHPLPAAAVSLEKCSPGAAARNAMPSLHLAAALVIWFVSRGWQFWLRIPAGLLVLMTVLATLGFGEHYAIDLVVAVPLVVATTAWSTRYVPWRSGARLTPLVGGILLTLIWVVMLRVAVPFFESRPLWSWSSILLTVILPLAWEVRLARFAARTEGSSADSDQLRCGTDIRQPYGLVGASR